MIKKTLSPQGQTPVYFVLIARIRRVSQLLLINQLRLTRQPPLINQLRLARPGEKDSWRMSITLISYTLHPIRYAVRQWLTNKPAIANKLANAGKAVFPGLFFKFDAGICGKALCFVPEYNAHTRLQRLIRNPEINIKKACTRPIKQLVTHKN